MDKSMIRIKPVLVFTRGIKITAKLTSFSFAAVCLVVLLSVIQSSPRSTLIKDVTKPIETSMKEHNTGGEHKKPIKRIGTKHEYEDLMNMLKIKFNLSETVSHTFPEYNRNVDQRSPLLTKNQEVIDEAQRIHMNLFRHLLNGYKFVILLDIATFENKGDPAITVGELHLLRKLKLEVIFHCKAQVSENLKFAKNLTTLYSNTELVILLHGGGNIIGYPGSDYFRSKVIKMFPDFEIIMFPQSIWIRLPEKHIRYCQQIYSNHSRLTFVYRDRTSFLIGKQLFPKVRPFLSPDMAFQMGYVPRFMSPTHDILWIRRGDDESTQYKPPERMGNYTMHVGDWWKWVTPKGKNSMEDPFLIATNGMMFLQRGRIVISDRLHGHILSTLQGIPQVLIDPKNRKISSYFNTWTRGLDNVILTNSSDMAVIKAIELLRKLDKDLPQVIGYHNSIESPTKEQIKNIKTLRRN